MSTIALTQPAYAHSRMVANVGYLDEPFTAHQLQFMREFLDHFPDSVNLILEKGVLHKYQYDLSHNVKPTFTTMALEWRLNDDPILNTTWLLVCIELYKAWGGVADLRESTMVALFRAWSAFRTLSEIAEAQDYPDHEAPQNFIQWARDNVL
ncbi:hypothetical protein SEA_FORZA_52 [Gordonia phage Forza]|uniref:Uncharacterized protein n=1 Tax=Gordonia phage Forza TaxID=2571247 RepID=A0A650EZE0_9CAUD|nr:hypothetical protein PP303_gp052 [Gordonia phage Forza]QEM41522.1 hypothetical protein SEA_BOOPY_53 [Gordonia phage Boopy]QGT55045.1 hypothetical protein SEA_FORZA_52 [Gordonia phage Forza]UXE04195.1 hypothetical protein SEA_BLUENGOLD_51 [Gordonia phage BlueNGold]WBF03834.1 hypothetical protein SEA_MAREELIH_51 [Gordonia phage Mareelih]